MSASEIPSKEWPPDYLTSALDGTTTTASHAAGGDDKKPPVYASALPDKFHVGSVETAPLVDIHEVEAHLRLLGAFWRLHQDVLAQDWGNLSPDARWAAFVARSAFRFDCWYLKVIERDGRQQSALRDEEVPPLDIAMIWHAYCLVTQNPSHYYEDSLIKLQGLQALGPFPLRVLSSAIDPTTSQPLPPSGDQEANFEMLTGEPFQPSFAISQSDTVQLVCPHCSAELSLPWLSTVGDTGYAQANFEATCQACSKSFGKEAMGVRRLCTTIRDAVSAESPENCLSGTLINYPSFQPDLKEAYKLNRRLRLYFKQVKSANVSAMGHMTQWSLGGVEYCLRIGMQMKLDEATQPRIRKILNCYAYPGITSLDLVGATLRQSRFIAVMAELGWLVPTRFTADKAPLIRSIARYHAWLDLMSVSGMMFLVPTLDIDLVWHTALLFPDRYRSDTQRVLGGKTPDHDDKIEEGALSDGSLQTARLWKTRFGVPYNYCGCVPPSEQHNFLQKVVHRGPNVLSRPGLEPSLTSKDDTDARPSHPSDHNSIVFTNDPATQKRGSDRRVQAEKRFQSLKKTAAKGKGDEWDEIVASRVGRHRPAFQTPIPGDRSLLYLPYVIDGSKIGASSCAAGMATGLCQAGGPQVFCGTGRPGCGANWGHGSGRMYGSI